MWETGRVVGDRREKPKRVESQDQETEEGQWGEGSSVDGTLPSSRLCVGSGGGPSHEDGDPREGAMDIRGHSARVCWSRGR